MNGGHHFGSSHKERRRRRRSFCGASLLGMVILFPVSAGCKVPDILFNALGSDHYTGGGSTPTERQDHFQRQMQEWEDFEKFGSTASIDNTPWDAP